MFMQNFKTKCLDHSDPFFIKDAQNRFQIMTAFQDLTIHTDNAVFALFAAQLWMFFNSVQGLFRCAPKY